MTRATLLGHVETMLQQMEYMSSSLATSVPGSERVGGRMRGAGRLTATSDGDVTSGRVAGVPGGGHRRGHTGGLRDRAEEGGGRARGAGGLTATRDGVATSGRRGRPCREAGTGGPRRGGCAAPAVRSAWRWLRSGTSTAAPRRERGGMLQQGRARCRGSGGERRGRDRRSCVGFGRGSVGMGRTQEAE